MTSITRTLAEFVVDSGIGNYPSETIDYSKDLALNHIACVVWGSTLSGAELVIRMVRQMGGTPESGVFGVRLKAPVINAVLANGTSAHAAELEGVGGYEKTNPFAVWPVAYTLGEKLRSPGRRVLESFVVGHEVQNRIARGCPKLQTNGGFPLAHFGSFGAAAAAAKLLGLNVEQTCTALSVAASFTSGLQRQVGTMTHYLEAGIACRNGVMAALLAQDGFTADPDMLDDKADDWNGYCTAIAGGADEDAILRGLGRPPFRVNEIGHKQYPCCYSLQHIIYGIAELVKKEGIRPEDVDGVVVEGTAAFRAQLDRPEPDDFEMARFSVQHAVAAAIIDSRIGHQSFLLVSDSRFVAMRKRVDFVTRDVSKPKRGNRVILRLRDGRQFDEVYTSFKGDSDSPLTHGDVLDKYHEYASSLLSPGQVEKIEKMMVDLEDLDDISRVAEVMTFPDKRSGTGVWAA